MAPRKVHHHHPSSLQSTMCGVSSAGLPMTAEQAKTTCGRCLKGLERLDQVERELSIDIPQVSDYDATSEAVKPLKLDTAQVYHDRKIWEPEPTIALYDHDCAVCQFLGHFEDFDMYFCPQDGRPTVIVRDGNRPEHYRSGLAFATQDMALAMAYVRAHQKGLI